MSQLLRPVSGPNRMADEAAGRFELPVSFDRAKYAARWEAETRVDGLREPQRLLGTNLVADGWEVWKDPNTHEPCRVALPSKTDKFILLCRAKEVQEAVTAKFGELSRTRMRNELIGETVGAGPRPDGILGAGELPPEPGFREEMEEDDRRLRAQLNQSEETATTDGVITRRGRKLSTT